MAVMRGKVEYSIIARSDLRTLVAFRLFIHAGIPANLKRTFGLWRPVTAEL